MFTTRKKNNLFPEETEGDGNCAFNALILGLSRQAILDKIDAGFLHMGEDPDLSMQEFIQSTATVLKVSTTWKSVKSTLMELRENNKVMLQKTIAPILRKLAVKLEEHDSYFVEQTIEPLLSAFDDFSRQQKEGVQVKQSTKDDIFHYHSFIQRKFHELLSNNAQFSTAIEELKKWWKSQFEEQSGHKSFLKEMSKDGVWAGDLELYQLARYFHINLDVLREDFIHRIYNNSGKLPRRCVDREQLIQLASRQIINWPQEDDSDLELLPLSEDEVKDRLAAIPECEKILTFIMEHPDLKGTLVPRSWPDSITRQLNARNMIAKSNDDHVFIVEPNDALERMTEIKGANIIGSLWKSFHYEAPTVTLFNPSGTHWSNTLPKKDAKPIRLEDQYFKYVAAYVVYMAYFNPPRRQLLTQGFFSHQKGTQIAADKKYLLSDKHNL